MERSRNYRRAYDAGSYTYSGKYTAQIQCISIIITTVLPLESFYDLLCGRDEPIAQLKRRCRTMIRLTRSTMDLYAYIPATQDYMLIGTAANPIAAIIKDVSAPEKEEVLKELCDAWNVEYKPEGLPSDYLD